MFICAVLANVLFIIFLVSATIQIGYVLYYFAHIFSLPTVRPSHKEEAIEPVSVIICAKNEAKNLNLYLPSVLAQRYTNDAGNYRFEVIVVDDASTDDTKQVLQRLSEQYDHLKIVTVDPNEQRVFKGKKHALSKALGKASHGLLVMTDADCEPASEDWLYHMVQPLLHDKEIVLGYGKYRSNDSFLNRFIRWETMHTFLQYATYNQAGQPYMAVGRNLACKKELLLKAQQSNSWNKIPSGDDDLLIATTATKKNTTVVAHPNAFTISDTKDTFDDWVAQKQRHMSTGKYYELCRKLSLGLYGVTHAAFWLSFIIGLFIVFSPALLLIFVARCIVYWGVWRYTAEILKEKDLTKFFPVFDFGWMVYNFALSPFIIWKNKDRWT